MGETHSEHFLRRFNAVGTHLHDPALDCIAVWDLQNGRGVVRVCQHFSEFWAIHFGEWLIAGNYPLCY